MTEFSKLKVNEKLSETQYYSVEKIQGDRVQLRNDLGENIVVDKTYVNKCLTSAEQFTSEKVVSKTEAANLFLSNPGIAMTVNYNKQVKVEDVTKEIMNAYNNSTVKTMETAVKKAVNKGLQGEERTMIGRHYGSQDEYGRVHFIDMEIGKDASKAYDNRQRLVDTRTINWLIIKGVKYTVK